MPAFENADMDIDMEEVGVGRLTVELVVGASVPATGAAIGACVGLFVGELVGASEVLVGKEVGEEVGNIQNAGSTGITSVWRMNN